MQSNSKKKLFSLKSFLSENILQWKKFYNKKIGESKIKNEEEEDCYQSGL
jgi:hypothetical protein